MLAKYLLWSTKTLSKLHVLSSLPALTLNDPSPTITSKYNNYQSAASNYFDSENQDASVDVDWSFIDLRNPGAASTTPSCKQTTLHSSLPICS